jgi:hypothetical protein
MIARALATYRGDVVCGRLVGGVSCGGGEGYQGSEKKDGRGQDVGGGGGSTYEEAGLADCAVADDNQLH